MKLLNKLLNWLEKSSQRENDAYLSKATDIFDLENRMRNLEDKKFSSFL